MHLDRYTIKDFAQAALAEVQALTANFEVVLDPAVQEAAFACPPARTHRY